MRILGPSPDTDVRNADRVHPFAKSAGSLHERLSAQAQRDPHAVAILAPERTPLDFGGLLDQIGSICTALNDRGLGRGDRIALLAARGPETAVAALGIACCAACLPLNAAITPTELEQALVHAGANALLAPIGTSAAIKDVVIRLGLPLLEYTVEVGTPAGRFHIQGGRAASDAQGGFARGGEIAFVMRTSGTTGRSKIVPISHDNIVARTDKTRRLLGLSPADRCLNPMPLCYNHGLNAGLMLPLTAGCSVICPPAFDAEAFLGCMREFSPTWYTASFTYHQVILEWLEQWPDALAGHRLRFARAGSGPLPGRVRTELEKILGAPLLEIYGSTETGNIAGNPPTGLRKAGTVGRSLGDEIAIMDADGNLLAPGKDGEVVVRGATVFGGYENDPAANERVFRGQWYRTGDQGVIDTDGYLKLLGRYDEIINRGGEKIAPREVDEALLSHDAVAQAVSFPVPHATLHQEIAAAVVLRPGAQVTGDELRRYLATRLVPFKVPRVILCTAELPKGPTGKLGRTDLAIHFGLAPKSAPKPAPVIQPEPRTETQSTLLALWRDALKRQDIGLDDDFFLLGGDSLSAVDLLHRIEQATQYQLPLNMLMEAPTVKKMEERLATATLGAIDNTLHIHADGTQRPLFAVPGQPGHCLRLFSVLRGLGSDQPCYGLQPPGMDWGSVGCETLEEMAAHYLGEVKAIQPHGPYRLLGDSFGGLIVYEMALQLQRRGESVEFLGLIDSNPPNWMSERAAEMELWRVTGSVEPSNWIVALNLRIAETHLRARCNYVLDGKLDSNRFRGKLTYFYCTGNPIVAAHDCRRLWYQHAEVQLLPLPGPHGGCDHEPTRSALRDLLRACLNDEPLTESDPVAVFDRTYRIDNHAQGASIVSAAGEAYPLEQDGLQGCVDVFRAGAEQIEIIGWAVDHERQPAQSIAVFVGDRYLGNGASGISRPDVVKRIAADSAQYAGFHFVFQRVALGWAVERPRLFVLSSNGRAVELPVNAQDDPTTLRAKLAEAENVIDHLRFELEAIQNTMSWRITSPLRSIRRFAARFFR